MALTHVARSMGFSFPPLVLLGVLLYCCCCCCRRDRHLSCLPPASSPANQIHLRCLCMRQHSRSIKASRTEPARNRSLRTSGTDGPCQLLVYFLCSSSFSSPSPSAAFILETCTGATGAGWCCVPYVLPNSFRRSTNCFMAKSTPDVREIMQKGRGSVQHHLIGMHHYLFFRLPALQTSDFQFVPFLANRAFFFWHCSF